MTPRIHPNDVEKKLAETFSNVVHERAPDWTDAVLRALASLSPPGCLVEPPLDAARGRGRKWGEFLWDLTISSYPRYKDIPYEYPKYFEAIGPRSSPELLLVAECEWGKYGNPASTGHEVMNDFTKIVAARCPLKVMVFSYLVGRASAAAGWVVLSDLMRSIIDASCDDAAYVLFGVALNGDKAEARIVRHRRGERGEDRAIML